ncbi:alpha-hydroxyacid dehydrogenase, FMN-dependent L-lactate dehydrogenase [Frankia torreyi]|uniref:Alpha-hydroxyacid dehydrogenase, FMN-dependent L-lactate dehydrogenase n=1 Tax=Frankia torreyi TaxID=1856 RepID=A0A0D8B5N4_9ACTN|nr:MULTISPECIES: alpha-hydroxy acid oxidase [Frankia]KJE19608.1 alpha-hydroxyacid dehydrogenase, FMN-dependent L-lactate dehydrogenase [Frankia torreyi]KQM02036.1 alpha-hydroxyacid dehydrogenase, FMN-dependent L-lactate dehydrogenase [Frankia sp. CpI1-P]
MRVQDAVNVEDVRKLARRRLPRVVFDALAGGAGDEVSLRRNRTAFDRIEFRPRPLADVATRDLSTTVFGERLSMPIMLAPTGAGRLARSSAEIAVARAAARANVVYMQSTVAAFPLEDVAAHSTGTLWYQLYLPPDRSEVGDLLRRIAAAGYRALAITIDTPVLGNRERDTRNRLMSRPPHPRTVLQGAGKPAWAADFVRGKVDYLRGQLGAGRPGDPASSASPASPASPANPVPLSLDQTRATIASSSDCVTWADVERIRSLWEGPLLLKGLMRSDECDRFVELGVDGVVVSNHGGRQLDGVPATIDILPEVVDAAAGRLAVFLDGGVRRGNDVAKALALGAAGVFVGRPYLYGLAAGGEAGVLRVIELLRAEFDRAMALLGAATVADLDRSLVSGARIPATRSPSTP